MWTCSKREETGVKVAGGERVWRVTFEAWQATQVRVHSLTSLLMALQMNREVIICCVALIPGCERSCS